MSVRIITGDLLEATEDYIAHQCNCVSSEAKTLAKDLFDKYPHANTYPRRTDKSKYSEPGTIGICGRRSHRRKIINMYAQYYPTGPVGFDTARYREKLFEECLESIGLNTDGTIAMPFKIGCGAARGSWPAYYKMIESFCVKFNRSVVLYKLKN